MVVYERQHVIINMDETALANVRHSGRGMASSFRRWRACPKSRPHDRTDRAFTHTTLMAVVCDSPGLQPLIPQVILARYTQQARVPASLQDRYRSCGFPFEFWHGTKGRVTPPIFRKWCTRLRQAVASYNPAAWIVLIMDCSTAHLDRLSVAHLRRLGFIVVLVPASLTWLLQILDVYVFSGLKRDVRQAEARARADSPSGQIVPGQWITLATDVIRREIINRDWSPSFARLGAGETCTELSSPVADLLRGRDITPGLPSRVEFAQLINRAADSALTRTLHTSIIGQALSVQRSSLMSRPPHSASYELPISAPALARISRRHTVEAMEPADAVAAFSDVLGADSTFLCPFREARNYRVDVPAGGED